MLDGRDPKTGEGMSDRNIAHNVCSESPPLLSKFDQSYFHAVSYLYDRW